MAKHIELMQIINQQWQQRQKPKQLKQKKVGGKS